MKSWFHSPYGPFQNWSAICWISLSELQFCGRQQRLIDGATSVFTENGAPLEVETDVAVLKRFTLVVPAKPPPSIVGTKEKRDWEQFIVQATLEYIIMILWTTKYFFAFRTLSLLNDKMKSYCPGQFDNVKELALVSIASMIGSCHASAHKAICNKVISTGMSHFWPLLRCTNTLYIASTYITTFV